MFEGEAVRRRGLREGHVVAAGVPHGGGDGGLHRVSSDDEHLAERVDRRPGGERDTRRRPARRPARRLRRPRPAAG